MKKELVLIDSRRLTGKNLLMDLPAAIIDVGVVGYDTFFIIEKWKYYTSQLQAAVGWQDYPVSYRSYDEGLSLAVSAPIDGLYAAAELNESAWLAVVAELTKAPALAPDFHIDYDSLITQLKTEIQQEQNPKLMALITEASRQNIAYLWDDDEFSLGYGASAKTWAIDQLPEVSSLTWQNYHPIPVVYVTGTNGKSTTVRIMAEIFKHSGKTCGVTSTDFIRVGQCIIDKGDYSGPGGARMLLRHSDVEVAVLEVARGGLLRRGLPVPCVDAAIITNVAEDHLGQYGINDIEALAQAKFLVAKGLSSDKPLVLNADDTEIVKYHKLHSDQLPSTICWFAKSDENPLLQQHRKNNLSICYEKEGNLCYEFAGIVETIVSTASIPMTLQGAAQHNVLNALGAIGLAKSLKISSDSICSALLNFKSDGKDNPGRGNFYKVNGATVIVDFAHNVHSMQAMVSTLKALPARKKWLMLGHAGDRSDVEIRNLTDCVMDIKPDYLMIVENPEYLRGRELGDIPKLISDSALKCEMRTENIYYAASPSAGTQDILDMLQSGDLVFLMVLSERDKVVRLLESD